MQPTDSRSYFSEIESLLSARCDKFSGSKESRLWAPNDLSLRWGGGRFHIAEPIQSWHFRSSCVVENRQRSDVVWTALLEPTQQLRQVPDIRKDVISERCQVRLGRDSGQHGDVDHACRAPGFQIMQAVTDHGDLGLG